MIDKAFLIAISHSEPVLKAEIPGTKRIVVNIGMFGKNILMKTPRAKGIPSVVNISNTKWEITVSRKCEKSEIE